jgi:hypothetical protein
LAKGKRAKQQTEQNMPSGAPTKPRRDGSTGFGHNKRDRFGKPFFRTWAKGDCPTEDHILVWVTVDKRAEEMGLQSGLWTFKKIKKFSSIRLREIKHYVKFGAQLKFLRDEKGYKGMFCANWVEGSDRAGYYADITPGWDSAWEQEQLQRAGVASPEFYHDMKRVAELAKFD